MIDLVKFIKNLGKKAPLPNLSAAAREVLAVPQMVPSTPYPLDVLLEFLGVLDLLLIKGNENAALEMGAVGGSTFQGVLKTYVTPGEPKGSVLAMRHGWRAHYNFGQLTADELSQGKVRFRLQGFPDAPMVFSLMMAGWAVGAARAAGSKTAKLDVLERPWRGAASFVYLVHC